MEMALAEAFVAEVHIYLTDGFQDDHVIVKFGGRTVFEESKVSYLPLYGFAKEIGPLHFQGESADIAVELPVRKLSKSYFVDFRLGSFITVALEGSEGIKISVLPRVFFG